MSLLSVLSNERSLMIISCEEPATKIFLSLKKHKWSTGFVNIGSKPKFLISFSFISNYAISPFIY